MERCKRKEFDRGRGRRRGREETWRGGDVEGRCGGEVHWCQ